MTMQLFERDLVEAEKTIVISSPGLRRKKVERLIEILMPRLESGVSVTVITREPDSVGYEDTLELHMLIDEMRRNGIIVRQTGDNGEHFAVIDKRLVWHGGMNLLGKGDFYDNLIRVENEQAATELLEIAEKCVIAE